ncbi:MAG: MBL fold metallo-hydrolase [Anaerolineales bacterium]|nr:MBL fold metallo-hydrolase [Anaerolineales bacterium]
MRRIAILVIMAGIFLTACQQTERAVSVTEAPVTPSPTPIFTADQVTITLVYDNTTDNPDLMVEWGFAALVNVDGRVLLFDTGLDGPSLMNNLAVLGIDPLSIEMVVISHEHGDHTGGLQAFLEANPDVEIYVPMADEILVAAEEAGIAVVALEESLELMPGVYTTGTLDGGIPEQGLVLSTDEGSVVITGCAHPGIVNIVQRAVEIVPVEPALVLGGFHLGGYSSATVRTIIEEFRHLGVQRVSPTHCTGEEAIAVFAEAYGGDYLPGGAGVVYSIGR